MCLYLFRFTNRNEHSVVWGYLIDFTEHPSLCFCLKMLTEQSNQLAKKLLGIFLFSNSVPAIAQCEREGEGVCPCVLKIIS